MSAILRRLVLAAAVAAGCAAVAFARADADPAPAAVVATRIDAASDAAALARDLYRHLRALDRSDADLIVVAVPPVGPAWEAIHDRLRRAATPADRG